MKEVEINKQTKLSPHFTLGEMTKTSYHTKDGNIPPRVAIGNLKRLCEGWLENLRYSYNRLYGEGVTSHDPIAVDVTSPNPSCRRGISFHRRGGGLPTLCIQSPSYRRG